MICRPGAHGSPNNCAEHEALPLGEDGFCVEGRIERAESDFAELLKKRHVRMVQLDEPPAIEDPRQTKWNW